MASVVAGGTILSSRLSCGTRVVLDSSRENSTESNVAAGNSRAVSF